MVCCAWITTLVASGVELLVRYTATAARSKPRQRPFPQGHTRRARRRDSRPLTPAGTTHSAAGNVSATGSPPMMSWHVRADTSTSTSSVKASLEPGTNWATAVTESTTVSAALAVRPLPRASGACQGAVKKREARVDGGTHSSVASQPVRKGPASESTAWGVSAMSNACGLKLPPLSTLSSDWCLASSVTMDEAARRSDGSVRRWAFEWGKGRARRVRPRVCGSVDGRERSEEKRDGEQALRTAPRYALTPTASSTRAVRRNVTGCGRGSCE